MNGYSANGPWSSEERTKHINELELLAAFNGLKSFVPYASNITVHLMMDNATSVSYINRCGGTKSRALNRLAMDIIVWCEKRHLLVRAFHIAGKSNVLADFYSRYYSDSSDWKLDTDVFRQIRGLWDVSVDSSHRAGTGSSTVS